MRQWGVLAGVGLVGLLAALAATRRRAKTPVAPPVPEAPAVWHREDDFVARIAAQLAHDIRSPLAALQIVDMRASELDPEKRTLLRDAVRRISDIANNLQIHHEVPAEPMATWMAAWVHSMASRLRFTAAQQGLDVDVHVDEAVNAAFAHLDAVTLRRIMARLFVDAASGCATGGHLALQLEGDDSALHITLKHPSERTLVMDQDATARIAAWNGQLRAQPGEVHITLPTCPTAAWFAASVTVPANTHVLVLDDDAAIGGVWRQRFRALQSHGVQVHVCRRIADFEAALREPDWVVGACLMDYELQGEGRTGLDVAVEFGLRSKTTIITSHYEDPAVLSRCEARNIKIVPKSYAATVPLRVA